MKHQRDRQRCTNSIMGSACVSNSDTHSQRVKVFFSFAQLSCNTNGFVKWFACASDEKYRRAVWLFFASSSTLLLFLLLVFSYISFCRCVFLEQFSLAGFSLEIETKSKFRYIQRPFWTFLPLTCAFKTSQILTPNILFTVNVYAILKEQQSS